MAKTENLPYHRKHRPVKILEYRGNTKLKETLMYALASAQRPQVLLLQGPAGTGKTSLARLLAKEYLCENRDTKQGACGVCSACRYIEEYILTGVADNVTNLQELDSADSNKRQDIDAMLEDATMPTFDGNWRVYILDECHKLSDGAQSRLLKTLEEPPEKVLIILCTTDPEKILETIRTRCQYVCQVQKPTLQEMLGLLKAVCKKEGVLYEVDALALICNQAGFVPRRALVQLEAVVCECKDVTYAKTSKVLNVIAEKYYFEFFELLSENPINVNKYINFLGKVKVVLNQDMQLFVCNLVEFLTKSLYVANGVMQDGLDTLVIKQYVQLFKKFTIPEIAQILEVLLSVKGAQDTETRLMVLGYKGLHVPTQEEAVFIDNTQFSARAEKQEGVAAYNLESTLTEEEQRKKLDGYAKKLDLSAIATKFGGTLIENPE